MILIGILMLIYVVPTLSSTFEELEIDLPRSTQFIINLSDFFQNNIIFLGLILAVVVFGLYYALKIPIIEKGRDWFLLRIPVVSVLLKEINTARTTRTLASLLSAGVPFVRALKITEDVVQNVYFKDVIKEAGKNIQLGLPISKVFREAEQFYPVFVSEMMAVGEETGKLAPMLLKVANFYEDEVNQKTQNISTIIEPVLMIVVGIVVAFFALSMLTPMYSLVDTI
jgi:type IV pilus assembly protein PilC